MDTSGGGPFLSKGLFHNDLHLCPVALCRQLPVRILHQCTSQIEPFFSSLCSGGTLAAAQSWTANTLWLALSTRLYPGQYISRSSTAKENNSPLLPPWEVRACAGLTTTFGKVLKFPTISGGRCRCSVSACSQKSRPGNDYLRCLPYLAWIPCYAMKEFQSICISLNQAPRYQPPELNPFLLFWHVPSIIITVAMVVPKIRPGSTVQ